MTQQEEKAITIAFFKPLTTRQRDEGRERDNRGRGRRRGRRISTATPNRLNNIITAKRGRGRDLDHNILYARNYES